MARHPLYLVDAFTQEAFRGNPAAVCLLRHPLADPVLQAVAAEMRQSETAFLLAPDGDVFASERLELRWFTPTKEVSLCGHATLATAKVLYDELGSTADPLTFTTRSGNLLAAPRDGKFQLDFPRAEIAPVEAPAPLRSILGGPEIEETYAAPSQDALLARLPSAQAVRGVSPDLRRMARELASVVIVTARGEPPFDFLSRCFAPALGIDEDPVTGMAHTILAPYWAPILGGRAFHAFQASARGGIVDVELTAEGRVLLRGGARIVLRGYLDLP